MRASCLFTVLLLIGHPAPACQCGTIRTAAQGRDVATLVFEGTAEEQIPALVRYERIFLPTQKVRFSVHRVWKGPVAQEVTLLEGPSNCSWNFAAGERYLVFASPHESEPGWMDAFKCTGPTGPIRWERSNPAGLGSPLMIFPNRRVSPRGIAARTLQHSKVYLISGVAVVYALGKGQFERSVRMWLGPAAVLLLAAVAAVFMWIRLSRSSAMIATAAICIVGILLFILVAGAAFVHTSGWWFEHLLETGGPAPN